MLHQAAIAGSAELAHARVQANFAALQSAERDYRQRRLHGNLPAGEAHDYEAYLGQLQRQFFAACAELAQFPGSRVETYTPCPPRVPRTMDAAVIDQSREQTQRERTTGLTQQLDAALSDFDEMLLREQERVKAATPPHADDGAGRGEAGATGDRDAAQDASTRQGRSSGDMAASDSGRDASASGTKGGAGAPALGSGGGDVPPGRSGRQGGRQQTAARGVPPDLTDGGDDDVVARQLREAAEKETDPELRARLWEEYRKYKRGTQ